MAKEEEIPVEKSGKRPQVRVISPGLINLGNTCFANSSLQVLAASDPLNNVLSSSNNTPPLEGDLTTPFLGLMRKIYRAQGGQSLNPKELYNAFVKKYTYFKPYTQQDAHEFMRLLLEGLKEEVPSSPPLGIAGTPESVARPTMKRTRRRTIIAAGTDDVETHPPNTTDSPGTYIDRLFCGKLASYVVCDTCKSISTTYEDYQDISLPIHDSDSPLLRRRDRFRAQFLRPAFSPFNSQKYSQSTSAVAGSDVEDAQGGMASDVGGYLSSGGPAESGHQSERRSLDEGERKKIALGKKFAKLTLKDKGQVTPGSSPLGLRLEPWGEIPEPPRERHEYLKNLFGEPNNNHVIGQLLGGDSAHRHHHSQGRESSPNPLSRSSSLSRTLSRIGERTSKTSLKECFNRFTNVETLDGDNKFACEECAKFLYPKRASKDMESGSSSDDDLSIHSPETITTPVAPHRKARRRALTVEKQETRGRQRSKSIKSVTVDSDASDSEPEEDNADAVSKESSKTSIEGSETTLAPTVPEVKITDASSSMTEVVSVPLKINILRPSISSAAPRYILRKAYKRIKLQYPLPSIMILHLNRFYGTANGSMKKIDDFVSFDPEFDFTPYVFPPPKKEEKLLFRLTGVVIHLGSINSGHYVSYFYTHKTLPAAVNDPEKAKKKDPNFIPDSEYLAKERPGQERREWVYASDTTVRAASVDEVLRARAYLLIYEKI